MTTIQWVRFAIMGAGAVLVIAIDFSGSHFSIAAMVALFNVLLLDAWCDLNANEKEKRIEELQREVRRLASMIESNGSGPLPEPGETGIMEK